MSSSRMEPYFWHYLPQGALSKGINDNFIVQKFNQKVKFETHFVDPHTNIRRMNKKALGCNNVFHNTINSHQLYQLNKWSS